MKVKRGIEFFTTGAPNRNYFSNNFDYHHPTGEFSRRQTFTSSTPFRVLKINVYNLNVDRFGEVHILDTAHMTRTSSSGNNFYRLRDGTLIGQKSLETRELATDIYLSLLESPKTEAELRECLNIKNERYFDSALSFVLGERYVSFTSPDFVKMKSNLHVYSPSDLCGDPERREKAIRSQLPSEKNKKSKKEKSMPCSF